MSLELQLAVCDAAAALACLALPCSSSLVLLLICHGMGGVLWLQVRPCVHGLKSEYNMTWQVELDGTPYTSPSQVCR